MPAYEKPPAWPGDVYSALCTRCTAPAKVLRALGSPSGRAVSEADLGETPNAQRLAKSNPYSVEGLMQSNNKFLLQYSITPDFKSEV